MKRTPTGIRFVDSLIEGGFPMNSNILLVGNPGSGKTIFGLEYLYRGVENFKENGLYISLEQSKEDLIEQAKCFFPAFEKLVNQKKIQIMYIPVDKISRDISAVIKDEARKIKAKRIVFDSISLLTLNTVFVQDKKFSLANEEELRVAYSIPQFIYNFIHLLESIEATTLIIKNPDNHLSDEEMISEYVCDGVVFLKSISMGKIYTRTLEIKKMRKTNCKGGIYSLKISKDGLIGELKWVK